MHRSKQQLYSLTSSATESHPWRHLDAERSRRMKVDDELVRLPDRRLAC
jgi:hypothetical protein